MSTAIFTTAPHGAPRYDDETRPLLGAWAISASVGVLWVGLVLFGPRQGEEPTLLGDAERDRVAVTLAEDPPAPPPTPAPRPEPPAVREARVAPPPATKTAAAPVRPRSAQAAAREPAASAPAADPGAAFGDAFATAGAGAPAGDVSGLLRGVRVSGGSDGAAARAGGKAVLSTGDGTRAGTPGRGRLGNAEGASIGTVGSGGGVARAAVRVSALQATGGSASSTGRGDGARLGTAIRSRESQLRFCYVDSGLRADPELAGSVTLALTLDAAGVVKAAEVARRSWSGDGAAAAENCILQTVRGWRFPAAEAGGTYDVSFSFTR